MKLTKTALIFLVVGIFVILVASLGVAYSYQGQEQSQLNQQLSIAQLALEKYLPQQLSSQLRELERQLAQAESQLGGAKTDIHQSIESIEVTDTLFEVARTCDVEIIGISSLGMTSKELEGFTYSTLSLRVKLEGDAPNLINFILKLSEKFPAGLVKWLEIDIPGVTEEELEKPSANLELCIHTYEGD